MSTMFSSVLSRTWLRFSILELALSPEILICDPWPSLVLLLANRANSLPTSFFRDSTSTWRSLFLVCM